MDQFRGISLFVIGKSCSINLNFKIERSFNISSFSYAAPVLTFKR